MRPFIAIHHALEQWQSKRNSRFILSSILTTLVLAILIPTLSDTYQLYQDRENIFELLIGDDQQFAAAQIEESGFLIIDGVSFGDIRLKGYQILNENGLVIHPAEITSIIIRNAIPPWIPTWLLRDPSLIWIAGGVALAWCLISVWIGLFQAFIYSILAASTSWFLFRAIGLPDVALVLVGMSVLGYSYHLLIQLFRFVFSSPKQIPAIARNVLIEATRTKISLAFVLLLLVSLPLIPIMLDSESPLRHQIQTMLSRSLGITFTIAAFLTVFLGCSTVAFEIRDRQIWQILTKPVSRLGYLLGKMLGIVSLNCVILIIAGLSVFMYMQYLRTAPVAGGLQGELDRLAVEEEILTAREAAFPQFESLSNEQIAYRVEQIIEEDDELRDEEFVKIHLRKELREEVSDQFLAQQRSIPPTFEGRSYPKTYTFVGLEDAKKVGSPLAFKYKFYIGAVDELETYEAGFVYNGDLSTRHIVTYVPTMSHVTMIPAYLINDEGELSITIYNLLELSTNTPGIGSIKFDKDAVKLLYKVGDFESNFFKAMVILLIKLSFLAALSIAASTFLSFPVACLVTFTIFASASLSPYLSESLEHYFPPSTADFDFSNIAITIKWAFEHTVHAIASAIVFCLEGFGAQKPTTQLVNGMLITWRTVIVGFATIGIVWSGLALTLGTIILRKRQLAIYSGSG